MTDVSHVIGTDLSIGPTGDLASVGAPALTTQRVLRRLLTNPGDYLWHLGYGGGLPRMVGQPANVPAITGVIRSQMLQEAAVAQTPPPAVTVSSSPDGTVFAQVQYTDAATGETAVLNVPLS